MTSDHGVDRSPAGTPRRQLLAAAATAVVGGVAGCSGFVDDTSDDLAFEALHRTATFIDDRVDLSVPDDLPTVSATNNADLIVLPGDPELEAEQTVDWLADDRVLALLGDAAEGTWLTWVQSDVYADTFDVQGTADGQPDPTLLVASAIGLELTRYDRSWSDGPRDRDVLRALDEILVDIEQRTAQ